MPNLIEENRKPSFLDRLGAGLSNAGQEAGRMAPQVLMGQQQQKQQAQMAQKLQQLTGMDLSGLSPEMQLEALKQFSQSQRAREIEGLKQQGKEGLLQQKQSYLDQLFGGSPSKSTSFQNNFLGVTSPELMEEGFPEAQMKGMLQQDGIDPSQIPDEAIARATAMDPNLGRILQSQKDVSLREKTAGRKEERKTFESERGFHTSYSKKAEEEADQLRDTIPKKENALNFARNAIETGDVGYFSPDKLADVTGVDLFRTAKGAQLITAGKENLLSNMNRVSARAQNQWFEMRLNSMFAKIGQSKEANLTVQEMLEGELALDDAYLKEFDKISSRDQEDYGYVKKDIKKRAHEAIKPLEKEIFNRSSYRMREIEEQEKGLSSLKQEVGKNVSKGTPMTLAMAKLYKDKFGDKALAVAKRNGYYIPTLDEFKRFRSEPSEFREGTVQ